MLTSREAGEDGVATMRTVGARSFVAKALPRFYREDTDALRIGNIFFPHVFMSMSSVSIAASARALTVWDCRK